MKDVIEFLEANNFKQIKHNVFTNHKADVAFLEEGYEVVDSKNGQTMYSTTLNIYWLIGMLTYYGYMDKNYIQNNKVSATL